MAIITHGYITSIRFKQYLIFLKMLEWIKIHKTEILLFGLGFGLRFLYALFVYLKFGSHSFLAYSDAINLYFNGAQNLIHYNVFSLSTEPPYIPDSYRVPLYIYLVAAFLWLKVPIFGIIFFQNVLAGFMSIFVYRIGLIIFDSKNIGLFAAVLMSTEPMSIYWNNLLMSDYLFAFLFIFAFYEFVLGRYYLFSLLFGLATLTRSIGVYFFPLFLLTMIWKYCCLPSNVFKLDYSTPIYGAQYHLGGFCRTFIITSLIFMITLFPWMLRNKIIFDTWGLSSASWFNLYMQVAQPFADKEGIPFLHPAQNIGTQSSYGANLNFRNVPFYKRNFLIIFKERPLDYIRFHTSMTLRSLFKNPYQYLVNYVLKPKLPGLFGNAKGESFVAGKLIHFAASFGGIFLALIHVLAILGFFQKKTRVYFALCLLIILVNLLTLGVLGLGADMSRYTIAIVPFILLFTGIGFSLATNQPSLIIRRMIQNWKHRTN